MDLMSFDDDVNTSLRPDPQNHPSPHSDVSNEDINALLSQQAEELFHACDRQNNNYITKNDLHQLVAILPLSEEQLDAVFDSLDDDKNGQLTLDEFTHGFGSFMGVPPKDVTDPFMTEERVYEITDDPDDYEANQRFQQMLEETGAVDVLPDMSTVKMLWSRLSKMEPEMLGNLEDFVYKISHNLKHTTTEFNSLQTALKSKSTEHDAEIQKLYEEMELQIRQEKDRVLSEEKAKERTLRDQMEKEIKDKDSQLQEIMNKHQNLESRLMDLNLSEVETKQENDRLQKERQNLEKMLMDSQQDLAESQVYISNIKHTQKEENRERARSALKVTEGIVLERESLIKQLDMLRDMNKKLRDEQDVAEACQFIRRIGK